MQQPPPVSPGFYYPPQQPFLPPPKRGPDVRTVLRLVMLAISLPCLAIVTYAIATHELEKKRDLIAFDNRLEVEAEVFVDGKRIEKIPPSNATRPGHLEVVKLPKVAKHLEVHAGGRAVSSVDLAIRPRGKDEKNGYRGLYVIGPSTRYAVAKIPYYAEPKASDEGPKLQHLGTPAPLVELPREMHVNCPRFPKDDEP